MKKIKFIIFFTIFLLTFLYINKSNVLNAYSDIFCSAGQYCSGVGTYQKRVGCVTVPDNDNYASCVTQYSSQPVVCLQSDCTYEGFETGSWCRESVIHIDRQGACTTITDDYYVSGTCCQQAGGSTGYCGDGVCRAGESNSSCPADCPPPPPPPDPEAYCGDGTIDPGETCSNCPADVGACQNFCGCLPDRCNRDESQWPGNGSCIRTPDCGANICPGGAHGWYCAWPNSNACNNPGPATENVVGYVKDQNGSPVSGVPMTILYKNSSGTTISGTDTRVTDSNGRFVFENLINRQHYEVKPGLTADQMLAWGFTSAGTAEACGNDYNCKNHFNGGAQVPVGSPSYNGQRVGEIGFDGTMHGDGCGARKCYVGPNSTGVCNDGNRGSYSGSIVHHSEWPSGGHCNFVFNRQTNNPPTGYFHYLAHYRGTTLLGVWGNNSNIGNGVVIYPPAPPAPIGQIFVQPGDHILMYGTGHDSDANLGRIRFIKQKFNPETNAVIGTYSYMPATTQTNCSPSSTCYENGGEVWNITAADVGTWSVSIEVGDRTMVNYDLNNLNSTFNSRCSGHRWVNPLKWSDCGNGDTFTVHVRIPPTYTISGEIREIVPLPTGHQCASHNLDFMNNSKISNDGSLDSTGNDDPREQFYSTNQSAPPNPDDGDWESTPGNGFEIRGVPPGTGRFLAASTLHVDRHNGIGYRLKCISVPGFGVHDLSSGTTPNFVNITQNLSGVRFGYEYFLTYNSGWLQGWDGDVFGGSTVNFNIHPDQRLGRGLATAFSGNFVSGVAPAKRAESNRWANNVSDSFWPPQFSTEAPAGAIQISNLSNLAENTIYKITATELNAILNQQGRLDYTIANIAGSPGGVALVYVTGTNTVTVNRSMVSADDPRDRILFISEAPFVYAVPTVPTQPGSAQIQFGLITTSSITFPTLVAENSPFPDTSVSVEGPLIAKGDIVVERNLKEGNAQTPAVRVLYSRVYLDSIRRFENPLRQYSVRWETN